MFYKDERCQEVAAEPDRPCQQTRQSAEAIVQPPKQSGDDKDVLVSSQEDVVWKPGVQEQRRDQAPIVFVQNLKAGCKAENDEEGEKANPESELRVRKCGPWRGLPVLLVNEGSIPGIKKLVPKRLRPLLLNLYCLMLDGIAFVRGRRDELTPPKRLLRFATAPHSDFGETGRDFVDFLVRQCALRPDHRVLDVGCGVGRVAVALTGYLDSNGGYEGFDIVPQEVAWCTTHVSSKFPNFRFQLADVRNLTYNPKGGTRASEYRFPYDDGSFDLVVLASVFTHMLSRDMERYLMEVSRVLKRGGRCFISFYLLNDEARKNIEAGTSAFDFPTAIDLCRVEKANNPESAVAHEEDRVRQLFGRCELLIDAVFYGTWSSQKAQVQDIILASRVML